jgi:pimeloyl-ACP methyl ester carboxylesterase
VQDINLWGETPNLTKEPIKFAPDIRRVKINADAHISSTETFVHASLDAPEFLLVIWGKHDLSFDLSEPEAYRRDVPEAEVHVLDAGHFALDPAADEIAALVRGFVGSPR